MDSIHCYILFVENAKILNNKTYSSIVKTRIALVAYNDGVPKNRLGAPLYKKVGLWKFLDPPLEILYANM